MIPLACREFDDNHRGICRTLSEMTTVYGKCGALHFLEEPPHQVCGLIRNLHYVMRKVK